MSDEHFYLKQHIFQSHHPPIRVDVYHVNDLTKAVLDEFLATAPDGAFGIAPVYGSKCILGMLAFSSESAVLVIRLSSSKSGGKSPKHKQRDLAAVGHRLLKDFILCHPERSKYAFKMDKLATALHLDHNLRITNGVDLLSLTTVDRQSLEAFMSALGGETLLNKPQASILFDQQENTKADIRSTAIHAWAVSHTTKLNHLSQRLASIARISTEDMNERHLDVLAKTIRDADRLVALKPTKVKNEIDTKVSHKQDKVQVVSTRFKTRVMRTSRNQTIEIETSAGGKQAKVLGRATHIDGRAATISLQGNFTGKIRGVTTVGREALTSAETVRGDIVLKALQQSPFTILRSPFVQRIWLPSEQPSWVKSPSSSLPISLYFPSQRALNVSQAKAVNVILSNSDADRVVLVHGPPGTGKTTVIAAAVTSVMAGADRTRTLWLVAQSNVAVKNMAEKLAVVQFFDFKLLVSKDFHYDWHEHLYEKIISNLIRSDDFVDDIVATERLVLGSRVILCTLSMLSHNKLSTFIRLVPPQIVIFDEASQIEIGDYFPMLRRFSPTLHKLVFIGDNKQLAPYGQGDIDDLRSIFEMPHLLDRAVFLDTQYRMPVPIGNFISSNVYENKLKSVHSIKALTSCCFVDVANGKEEKMGFSWMNFKEIRVAICLAGKFNAQGKTYRIITPYDAQRSQLENALKAAKLPWEDRCFNIDSFQGNEADYIIVSLVRSEKIGFMKDSRRVNVMLTRLKKGMIICTSRAFVEGMASSSLVGNLAKVLGPRAWVESRKILYSPSYRLP